MDELIHKLDTYPTVEHWKGFSKQATVGSFAQRPPDAIPNI